MARPSSRSRTGPLSLEASLDEENREVLAALDRQRPHSPGIKSNSRTHTPPPRVRSMLDVDSPSTPRHGSIAGIGVGITSPIQHRKDSTTLDPADPSTWTSPHSSKPNSPTLSRAELKSTRPRGASDASPTTSGHVGLPRTQPGATKGFERDYQFDLSSIPTTGKTDTKRTREGSNNSAMAAALSGDFSNLHVGRPLAASHSHSSGDSRSPSGRIRSPASESSGLLSPTSPPAKLRTAQGTVVDENAHRRLSNKSSSFSTVSDDPDAGQGRVPTDTIPEDDAVESSDEDGDSNASDDDTRGRDRDRKSGDETESPVPDSAKTDDNDSQTPSPAEERKPHATPHSQIIKSMLEPSISVTGPSGEKMSQPSSGVHPESNFDKRRMSTSATSVEDDGEDDIAKAKSLGLNISPLDTKIVDRHVRIIIRGDWTSFQKDPESEGRHNRTYLLCSDLSVEATYALEWTVGTIMRDGDTLLAIYAIEDENAGSPSNSKQPEAERERLHEEGAEAGKAANATMADLTRQTTNREGDEIQSKFIPATEAKSLTGSVDARKVGKKEMDRLKAIDEITQSFLRLVRKTTLQVRCMVEVIHCKSPKHLILGAIDQLEPTLTIVGTRGRSSLKGVLLGSFSNYLVTKSSSPVMVARRKLKKPKSQARIGSNKIRLSNNLMASAIPGKRRSLTQARID